MNFEQIIRAIRRASTRFDSMSFQPGPRAARAAHPGAQNVGRAPEPPRDDPPPAPEDEALKAKLRTLSDALRAAADQRPRGLYAETETQRLEARAPLPRRRFDPLAAAAAGLALLVVAAIAYDLVSGNGNGFRDVRVAGAPPAAPSGAAETPPAPTAAMQAPAAIEPPPVPKTAMQPPPTPPAVAAVPPPASSANVEKPPVPSATPEKPPAAPAVAVAPATIVQPPPLDRARLHAELARLFHGFPCADLDAEIADDGAVTLTGFVARSDELMRLAHATAALPQVARVDNRATIEPWPFCSVVHLLRTRTSGGPAAPVIEFSHPDLVYRAGDVFRVTATARAPADSYLYVDYFETDGRVVHLLPTRLRADNRVAPEQPVALGAEPDKARRNERVYRVAAPYGTGMVIALSSRRKLFAAARPEQEDARAYLAALADVLAAKPGDDAPITATQQFISLAPAVSAPPPPRTSRLGPTASPSDQYGSSR